jgi:hypothetical protein
VRASIGAPRDGGARPPEGFGMGHGDTATFVALGREREFFYKCLGWVVGQRTPVIPA